MPPTPADRPDPKDGEPASDASLLRRYRRGEEDAATARRIASDQGPLPAPAAVALELAAPIHVEQRERLFAR